VLGGRASLQLDDDLAKTARVDHGDLAGDTPGLHGACEYQHGIHQLVVRRGVVVAQVACVGGHLVHMGALQQARFLELEDHRLRPGEDHYVWSAAALPGQFVLEDDGPVPGPRHGGNDLAERHGEDLVLAAPGSHLQAVGAHTHDLQVAGGKRFEEGGLVEGQELGNGAVPAAGGDGCYTRFSGRIRRCLSLQRAIAVRDSFHLTTLVRWSVGPPCTRLGYSKRPQRTRTGWLQPPWTERSRCMLAPETISRLEAQLHYHFAAIVGHDADGYWARCPELQGCYTQGRTYEEALANLREAVGLHVEDRLVSGEEIPQVEAISLITIELPG